MRIESMKGKQCPYKPIMCQEGYCKDCQVYIARKQAGNKPQRAEKNWVELMTVEEVAGYLHVAEKTVYRLLEQDSIPATRVGHQWRFDKVSLDEWLQRKSIRAKS